MSIMNLFKLDYWFSQPYIAHGGVLWFWLLSFLLLFLAGLIIRFLRNYQKDGQIREVYRRFSSLCSTLGLTGLVWMFFRQERVAFLAWRFWLLFLAVAFVWWLVKNIIYTMKRLPAIREEKAKREVMEKYLPRRK